VATSSFFGDAHCNGNCSGYDTSQCLANVCDANVVNCQNKCDADRLDCRDMCEREENDCVLDHRPNCSQNRASCDSVCDSNLNDCLQQCDPKSCYWYQVPVSEDKNMIEGMACMAKMNVDSGNQIICDNNLPNSGAQWFKGTIVKDKDYGKKSQNGTINRVKYCFLPGCDTNVEPNKCRYNDGAWTGFCYIHKFW